MKLALFLCLAILIVEPLHCQDQIVDDMSVKRSFLIVKSTKNYSSALKTAKQASFKLNCELNLRGMVSDSIAGLTSIDTCGCGEIHGYYPRGRYDNGAYVSIEYSNLFSGFAKGYYIVVVASGNSEDVKKELPKAKLIFPDAYIKSTSIYMGCVH
ncbi:MAG: hypothetical protein AB8B72_08825 [Crocinitomicaceae bacterium]